MFSDQYKKENEKLNLDDEFLMNLSMTCKNEATQSKAVSSKKHSIFSTPKKALLIYTPFVAACILLVICLPHLTSKTSKMDDISYDLVSESEEELTEASNELFDKADESVAIDTTSEESEPPETGLMVETDLDLTISHQFITTPPDELEASLNQAFSKQYSNLHEITTLDYADNNRLIFHINTTLFIYDLEKKEFIRILSLDDIASSLKTNVNQFINTPYVVTVYNEANYIQIYLKRKDENIDLNEKVCLYDVQTNDYIILTRNEIDSLFSPAIGQNLMIVKDEYRKIKDKGTFLTRQLQLSKRKYLTLYFKNNDTSSIKSMGYAISDNSKKTEVICKTYSLFDD